MFLARDSCGYVLSEYELTFDSGGDLIYDEIIPIPASIVEESGLSLLEGKHVKVRFEVIE